jgi:hypothetical protein
VQRKRVVLEKGQGDGNPNVRYVLEHPPNYTGRGTPMALHIPASAAVRIVGDRLHDQEEEQ